MEATGAYERGDFTLALDRFRAVAAMGDGPIQASAQYWLGQMYQEGKGVTQDLSEAIRWWGEAAEHGHAEAQHFMGVSNLVGTGRPQNYSEAVRWFRRAAEQGHAGSQALLGDCYADGKGVAKNYSEAAKWYRLAAEQGNPYGQAQLGFVYASGKGVVQNYIQAHAWLNLAASRIGGLEEIGENVAKARDDIAEKMTPEQLAEAQRLASEWSTKLDLP